MEKAVRVLNRLSTVLFIAILLLVYAYLPIQVDLNLEEIGSVHKQRFFYYSLVAFVVINLLLRVILNMGFKNVNDLVGAWLMGLIFVLNFYLTLIIGFIGVLNNATHISPSNYAYLNFLGPIFIVIWLGGLIFLALRKS